MGIQSTQRITRKQAIERVKEIFSIVDSFDYRQLELISFEDNLDVEIFINENHDEIISFLEKNRI